MKKAFLVIIAVSMTLAFGVPSSDACVGKLLTIGAMDSPEGQVLAEMISTMINERTGTTVNVRLFRDEQELYEAVKAKMVDILIDNTSRALQVLNSPAEHDARKAYEVVKTAYEKELGLVWLKPFAFLNSSGNAAPSYTAALLRVEIITNFPALPRVIDKLGSAVNDESHAKLLKLVESGDKPKKVARDFLKSKKLI